MWMKMQPQFGVQIQERRGRSDGENETEPAIERGTTEVHQRERKKGVGGEEDGKSSNGETGVPPRESADVDENATTIRGANTKM